MFSWQIYWHALVVMGVFALAGWVISVIKRNVTLVDSMWSLFFLLAASVYAYAQPELSCRATLLLVFIGFWAVRLSGYLTWRNWSPHEDHRYQEIRKNNEPHFWLKSLYIVFGFQLVLAWVISLPLLGAINSSEPLGLLDAFGALLWLIGFLWESIGDWQLANFKAKPENKGKVMDKGLWRLSRHPNYFGEFCIWWGYFLLALSAGAWWSLLAPVLMTLLLLKVSGVALLEKDIAQRRPAYAEYIANTNAFFPGPPKP